jgi:hypothetical protein
VEITRKVPFVAVSLCLVLLCVWFVFIGLDNPATNRRVANVALSNSGRWLAAGTAKGGITLWDQTRRDPPKQVSYANLHL